MLDLVYFCELISYVQFPISFLFLLYEGTVGSSISKGLGIEDSTDDEEYNNGNMFEAARNEF